MGLKENYINLKKRQLNDKVELDRKHKELSYKKQVLANELKIMRNEMLRDKGARDDFGITNQKDWQIKINELTGKEEEEKGKAVLQDEAEVMALEMNIAWRDIDITDAYWDLQIGIEQIKMETAEKLMPCVETNPKDHFPKKLLSSPNKSRRRL